MPELHIITGSNGAGKSSIGSEFLPAHIKDVHVVFDGDRLVLDKIKELVATKSHGYKDAKNFANEWIGSYFNDEVTKAINKKAHFVYEGHFREDHSWKVITRFRKCGYTPDKRTRRRNTC